MMNECLMRTTATPAKNQMKTSIVLLHFSHMGNLIHIYDRMGSYLKGRVISILLVSLSVQKAKVPHKVKSIYR